MRSSVGTRATERDMRLNGIGCGIGIGRTEAGDSLTLLDDDEIELRGCICCARRKESPVRDVLIVSDDGAFDNRSG